MATQISAKIIADSVNRYGERITTVEATIPRVILAEMNTHGLLAKNSASSRAIPATTAIEAVVNDTFFPRRWGKKGKGMEAREYFSFGDPTLAKVEAVYQSAAADAIRCATLLDSLGLHKQHVNRLIEPYMWHKVLLTGTDWSNFFNLRCHQTAEPSMEDAACAIRDALKASTPTLIIDGWHLPFINPADGLDPEDAIKVSVASCGRISYTLHDKTFTVENSVARADEFRASGHMSPFDHPARPMTEEERMLFARPLSRISSSRLSEATIIESNFSVGNAPRVQGPPILGRFTGWVAARKLIPNEQDIMSVLRGEQA